MRSPDVLVVGDALLDVHVAPSEAMRPGGDVPAAVRVGPGGQGANLAVRLARRGVRTRLACTLGDDAAGRLVREALVADDVDLDVAPADATGAVVILVGPDGERTMLSHRSPLLPRSIDAAPWTAVSGYVLLEDAEVELRGAKRVALLGCSVPTGDLDRWWRRAGELSPDLLFLNRDEAAAGGAAGPTTAGDPKGIVVVTSPDGARAVLPGGTIRRAVSAPGAAVDTTGAGDAFAAAFLAEVDPESSWTEGDIDRALAAGSELAAQVAATPGAQALVPLERQGPPA